jgi:hypothetical protein
MKYLENVELEKLSYFISNSVIGNTMLKGRIEAFSCKKAGDDKKLSKSLDQKFTEEYGGDTVSSSSASTSIGDMSQNSTRKLLIDLVQTMNASFIDHDFSSISPESFRSQNVGDMIHQINSYLNELTTIRPSFINDLWSTLNAQMNIHDCEAYCYVPDFNDDPLSDGAIWSFNCFFFNKELKRICYFTCVATPRGLRRQLYGGDDDEEDADADMDMEENESFDEHDRSFGFDEDLYPPSP